MYPRATRALHSTILSTILFLRLSAAAVELPAGFTDLSVDSKLTASADGAVGKATRLEDGGWRIQITEAAPDAGWRAQFAIGCPGGAIAEGDRVIALIKARCPEGSAKLETKLQTNSAPWTALADSSRVDLTSEWKEYPVLMKARKAAGAGTAALTIFAASRIGTAEVATVRVVKYPSSVPVESLPRMRITYPGREPDAAWRRDALARIEAHRKNDLSVRMTDGQEQPVSVTGARVVLRRHHFGFGSATPAYFYASDTPDAKRYLEIVNRTFSMIVFENDLKDFYWGERTYPGQEAKTRKQLDAAFAWLEHRRIAARGHYLMQVAIPPNLHKASDDEVRKHFLDTTRTRIEFAGDRVMEWDVINHPVAWEGAELFSKRPGLRTLDREVFTLARQLSKLPMAVNEDQIFRPGKQSDGTFDYIRGLKSAGFKVDALGNQAHIDQSYLPPPDHILKVTDKFATVVPRQLITEFDVVTTDDEELAADYTRDALIATFSHPAYSAFLLWGFWEGSHWKPEAASWNKDWSIRGRGKVWEEWIGKRWSTETTVSTGTDGLAGWRGFPGWYEISFEHEGVTKVLPFHVTPGNPSATVDITRESQPIFVP